MNNSNRRRSKSPRLPEVLHNWQVSDDASASARNTARPGPTARKATVDGEVISSKIKQVNESDASAAPRWEQRDDVILVKFAQRRLRGVPGSAATTRASVLNNGSQPLVLDVSFALAPHAEILDHEPTNLPTDEIQSARDVAWLEATPATLHLAPGQRAEVQLVATPPRTPLLTAGDYPLMLTVSQRSEVKSDVEQKGNLHRTTLAATLTVEPLVDLQLALSPTRWRVRWQPATRRPLSAADASTSATLTNLGNCPLPLRLEAMASTALRLRLAEAATVSGALLAGGHHFDVVLRPGETRHIPLHVSAAGPHLLRPRRQPLHLAASISEATSLAADGDAKSAASTATDQRPYSTLATERVVLAQTRGVALQQPLLGPWTLVALATTVVTLFVALAVAAAVALVTTPLAQRAQPAASPPLPPQVIAVVMQMDAPIEAPAAAPVIVSAAPSTSSAAVDGIPQAAPTPTAIVVQSQGQPLPADAAPSEDAAAEAPSAPQVAPPADQPAAQPANLPAVDAASGLPIVQPEQITGPGESAVDAPPPVPASPTPAAPTPAVPSPAVSAPPPAANEMTYAQMFQAVGLRYDLDWRLLAAQAYIESSFDPNALGTRGDMGLMQILPETWAEWSPVVNVDNPFDSYSNVLVAAAYLDNLRSQLSAQGYAEERWMLAAYNAGPDTAQRAASAGGWTSFDPVVQRYAEDILRIAESIP